MMLHKQPLSTFPPTSPKTESVSSSPISSFLSFFSFKSSGSHSFSMHSSLCSYWNFSFLPYYTNSAG